MKFNLTFVALALTAASSSVFAVTDLPAVGGTVHFTGYITDSTCEVNGSDGANFDENLDLGTYLSSDFTAIGDTTTPVPLSLSLSNCPETITGVSVRVTSSEGEDANSPGDFAISSGGAEGVAIRLLDDENSEITYGQESKTYSVNAGEGTVLLNAEYVATATGDSMVAGPANLDATVAVNYK